MNTNELFITDLLNCGYADLNMLDILYSTLAEDVGLDSADVLRSVIKQDGDLNSILYLVYNEITSAVYSRLCYLIEEYNNTLQDYKPTTDTENTGLYDLISEYMYNNSDELIGLSKEHLNLINECIKNLEQSYPYCNYLDSYFQNELDQTLNEDEDINQNIKNLLEYIFQSKEL